MLKRQDAARSRGNIDEFAPPNARKHPHSSIKRFTRAFIWLTGLGLILIFLNVLSGIISSPLAYALPVPASIQLKGAPSTPNTVSATVGSQSLAHLPQQAKPGSAKAGPSQIIKHNTKMPMQAASIDLQVGKTASFTGSDKRLELDIPAGAVTAQDVKAAGGKISLKITQIAPGSGSNAGGSGEFSLGAYLLQLVDAHGKLLTHGLRKAFTARYHLQKGEKKLYLDHAFVVFNGPLSQGATALPGVVQPSATNTSVAGTMGKRSVQHVRLDTTAKTLTVTPQLTTPTSSMSWDSDSPIATFGKPDPASVGLSAGSLAYSEAINLPAGPGGLTPPVSLTYSSEAVNEQHNPSGAAGWVGEGWSLSTGEISWSESNVLNGCSVNDTCGANGTTEWESVWNLSDPYGTSSQLIPPNINVSSYYDDSSNYYCATGNSAAYPCPILWHTATASHDKIYMYVGPVNIGQPQNPPCWRVWLPNGIMEEFGCTSDSLQYYYEAGLGALITGWKLDMITDPQGNQIHFTYQRDMENWTSIATGKTYSYPRDAQLSSIQYDSPGCHNAQTMCTGSAWAPQMQVVFNANHTPTLLTGTAPSGCNTAANVRCDDPVDLSGNNGIATSLIQSTFVLNSVQVQVRTSGTASWNTLNTYKLGYEQSGPSTATDPGSGQQRSIAGMLDLTSFQEVGSDGSTKLPTETFGYTNELNTYVDSFFKPNATAGCGPSWNASNCFLWQANSLFSNGVVQGTPTSDNRFLTSVSNGQGLAQTFTYAIAHNNSHGAPGGGAANANPLACDSSQSGSPCNEADDSGWSRAVVTAQSSTTLRVTQNGQGGTQTSTPITETTDYSYQLNAAQGAAGGQECSDCLAGMYWGNQNDDDYLGFYNAVFTGFAQAKVVRPSGEVDVHHYYSGEGWGVYDTGQVTCYTAAPCHNDPWWALANAAHGDEYESQVYDADGTTLLSQVNTTYTATCPPSGVSGTPASAKYGNWDGKLVSILDHNNPVAACEIEQTQQTTQTSDGGSNPVTATTNWTYDSYGRVTQETTTSNGGTPAEVVKNTSYVWNDNVSATSSSATGTYIIDKVASSDTEDGAGNQLSCSFVDYDGPNFLTGQTSSLTEGLATNKGAYTDCANASNNYEATGFVSTATTYDAYGDVIGSDDADADADMSSHYGCQASDSNWYTTCATYDNTFDVFQTSATNDASQTTSTSYGNTSALFGYGTWPASTTDANGQTTGVTYDALGRMTGLTLPGETSGEKTRQWVYTNWCSGTSAQAPCEEIDEIDRLDSGTTTTTRAFYDGEGRLVETRAPGPTGQSQDVVTFAFYDTAGRQIFKSDPYFVAAYTGNPGAAAYSIPDISQPGTSSNYYPNAGITNLRTSSVTDPNSHKTTTTTSVICSVPGTSDTGCYAQTMVVDANGHEHATLVGGMGKTNYTQTYTGTSGGYALYSTTKATYDAAGNHLTTVSPDGSTSSATYDDLGHVISETDPDRGTTTLTYDPNGNVIESVDARGSAGTVYTGYDGLNRPLWQNSTNSETGAWATYTYDSTANGNDGIGQLTSESFTGSGGLSGSYAYTFDDRGQQTAEIITVSDTNLTPVNTSYSLAATYNDNGQAISETYPTGEVVTPGYDNDGWLTSLNTKSGGITTTIASNLAYSGLAGAAGQITTMDFGSGDVYTASFDSGMRLTSATLTQASTGELMYQTQPAYDAANNVVSVQTSINGATDTQQFCYDSLNRMTWAGSTGTPPCAGLTPGTLTAAQYQQSYSFNVESGLTNGSAGSVTYGNSAHPHAVTSTSNGYNAAYDALGDETCRALTTATTCSGTQTGQQLSYDPEGRLTSWQNTPTSPTSTANYLYDGSGNRIAMQTTVNGTTTLTTYIGSIEEVQKSGSTTTTTTYYAVGGKRVAANVNGTFYYFGYDALGSQVAVFNNSGNLIGSQLYGPYGNQRYSNGTLPTSIGFTGQQADSVTGLDYYNARYYDPAIGQFLSADVVQGNAQGADPYSYVGGNPETRTDPTGQRYCQPNGSGGCNPVPSPGGSGCVTGWSSVDGVCVKDGTGCQYNGNPCSNDNNWCKNGVNHWDGNGCAANPKPAPPKKTGVDKLKLGEGIAEFVAALGLVGVGIAGYITAADSGVLWFVEQFLKNGFGAVAALANAGIKNILSAFGGAINPWVKVFFDVVAIVLNIVQIAQNLIDLFSLGSSLKNARVLKDLGEQINQVVGHILIDNPGRLLETWVSRMKGLTASTIFGGVALIPNINSLVSDWTAATSS